MSIYDRFRNLAGNLFDRFDAASGTLTRTNVGPRTNADRAAGRVTSTTSEIGCRVLFGTAKRRNREGVSYTVNIARLNVEPIVKDKLTVRDRTDTITEVSEISPDGTTGIIWVAVLS